MLKDLQGASENKSTVLGSVFCSTGTKPYLERIEHHLKRRIPEHGHSHHSLEFTFDPSEFVCDPSKIISRVFGRGFGRSGSGGGAVAVERKELELDGG